MIARLCRRPGYPQITEIPHYDFCVAGVSRSLRCTGQTIYRLQTGFPQPGRKKSRHPQGDHGQ